MVTQRLAAVALGFIAAGCASPLTEPCVIAQSDSLSGQGVTAPSNLTSPTSIAPAKTAWTYGVSLRRSLADKNGADKPATVQYLNPDHGSSSYSIDAGLKAFVVPPVDEHQSWQAEWGVGGEFHRNTQEQKEQDSRLAGPVLDAQFGNPRRDKTVWFLNAAVKYKEDRIKKSQSMLPSVQVEPMVQDFAVNDYCEWGGVSWFVDPVVGVEYEDVFHATNNGPEGSVLRPFASAQLSVFPLDWIASWRRRVEAYANYKYWRDAVETSGLRNSDDNHDLFAIGVRLRLDPTNILGLTLEYSRGENPTEGRTEQGFLQIAFTVKL